MLDNGIPTAWTFPNIRGVEYLHFDYVTTTIFDSFNMISVGGVKTLAEEGNNDLPI